MPAVAFHDPPWKDDPVAKPAEVSSSPVFRSLSSSSSRSNSREDPFCRGAWRAARRGSSKAVCHCFSAEHAQVSFSTPRISHICATRCRPGLQSGGAQDRCGGMGVLKDLFKPGGCQSIIHLNDSGALICDRRHVARPSISRITEFIN